MTDPGRKRLVRYYDGAGRPLADIIRLADEAPDVIDPGQPAKPVPFAERHDLTFLRAVWDAARCEDLLQPVMRDGRRMDRRPRLDEIRARAQSTGGGAAGGAPAAAQPRDLRCGPFPRLAAEKVRLVRQAPGVLAARPRLARYRAERGPGAPRQRGPGYS